MNILVLGKYYPPHRGGIETLTRNWCEGFAARGARVRCVVAHPRAIGTRELCNGVAVERCGQFGTLLSTPVSPGYLLAARRCPADIVQLHYPNPLADVAMLLQPRNPGLVITWHSDIVRQATVMGLYRPLLDRLLRRADRIVVATPPQLEHSPVLAAHRDRCEIIPFGLDLAALAQASEPPPEILAARTAAAGRLILLNIGRLVGYKGQRHAIEALARLDAVLWLVGAGPLRTELEHQAAAAGVADRVRFWGEVDDALLPALLHACDIFVLPSITPNEAFGLVQVEAMACGKPVVSCRLASGVPYVNKDGVTGFVVPPADAGALADAIRKLAADPELRARMGDAGKTRARIEFALEVMVNRYWQLFRRVLEERKAA